MGLVHGIVLAAGAGARYGQPKALARDADGRPWVALAEQLLRGAGCQEVTVVLGAAVDAARKLVPPRAQAVVAEDWASGLAASLRAGLRAAAASGSVAALVTLVDLPDLPVEVALRVLEGGVSTEVLRQATFARRPGHPVLLGRDHWPALVAGLSGDRGARPYLLAHDVTEVECGDLSPGLDVDTPRSDSESGA
ncbi:nucleotidyltransferase family protein [Frondihabitans sucicola]|nr:NTP transferase domain-containing protein [Frondihabitans sucicola]